MDNRIKQIMVPFFAMMVFDLGIYLISGNNYSEGLSPHVGLLPIAGIIFGPYGAIGAVLGNTLCDILRGYSIGVTVLSEILSLAIALMAYKAWYQRFRYRRIISRPKLNNTSQIILFLGIIVFSSISYALINKQILYLASPETQSYNTLIGFRYFINFLNSAFIVGIIGIKLSKYIDFVHLPKITNKKVNDKLYLLILILLFVMVITALAIDSYVVGNSSMMMIEIAVLLLVMFAYALKPVNVVITDTASNSIPEQIMNIFFLATLGIICVGILIASDDILIGRIDLLLPINYNEVALSIMLLTDLLLMVFFVPSLGVMAYVERRVVNPIVSFSEIEKLVKKGNKIEAKAMLEVYSKYLDNDTEIGNLARSYTNLINFTNDYIENIRTIESEKKRIEAELEIAEKIQQANLPTNNIENEEYFVSGYSKPAKEVGGDFYDYYAIDDENIAIIIGDASGKGVPAALLSVISQAIIRQLLKNEHDPSEVLFSLNNQICENNPEFMFITIWIGIYNTKTNMLTFSNAGHDRPLIIKNGKVEFLEMNRGIVLGVMEDFEFVKEELEVPQGILLYTDGITDEKNVDDEFYGEERLVNFIKNNEFGKNIVNDLIKDIESFTKGKDQFDDMTVVILERNE